jgi:hypothetical protein
VGNEVEFVDFKGFEEAECVANLFVNTEIVKVIAGWPMAAPTYSDNPVFWSDVRKEFIVEAQVMSPSGEED